MSPETVHDLSVIIVNWNTCDLLRACLLSIINETKGVSYEIIVADNASDDDSADMVASEFPTVKLLRNQENVGFSRANNQGMVLSRGRYVFILNPDTIILENAPAQMAAFADSNPDIGALGPKILVEDGRIDHRCARRLPTLLTEFFAQTQLAKRFPAHPLFGRWHIGDWDHTTSRDVACLAGAAMLVRREVIEQLGGFDEDFFMYGEDLEWCYRIRTGGWRVYYHAQAQIIHLGGKSSEQNRDEMGIEYIDSMALFFQKRYGRGYAFTYRSMIFAASLFKLGIFFAQGRFGNKVRRDRFRDKVQIQRSLLRWALGA